MEELSGVIRRIIFRNASNGWTVMEVNDETGEEITAVGVLPQCSPGERVRLTGGYTEHPRYGLQFKTVSCEVLAPATLDALENYLGSGLIKGVGEATAKRIVAAFGMDTLDVLENHPERLQEISGIGHAKAASIAASFFAQRASREAVMALQAYGISLHFALKFYQIYGPQCIVRIQENPYSLIEDVDGVDFKTADRIARSVGIEHDSRARMQAGLSYILRRARQDGHTFVPRELLIRTAGDILEVAEPLIEEALDDLILRGAVIYRMVEDTDAVYLPYLYQMERDCARKLLEIQNQPAPDTGLLLAQLGYWEKELNLKLAPQQRSAILRALEENVMVITGGPGTGKTTIIRFIVHALSRAGLELALCAPTGRAAKRMEEATGQPAFTIHRLLEYGIGEETFARNADNPILYDMVVVDEISMIDLPLMHALLNALPAGTRLVMVGDADQLPPVGAGNVLHDIIKSGTIPVVRLTEIFRQAQQSLIVTNAHRINEGIQPVLDDPDADFIFEEINDPERVLERIVALCTDSNLRADPFCDIQVLAPMKKGTLGVRNLNARLQAALNPPAPGKPERLFGETIFREGDKIMQVKNDYKQEWIRSLKHAAIENGTGVFNGDIGTIYRLDVREQNMQVLFDDGRLATYDFTQLEELELAYCMSIHKSQGSEFPIVLLPLVNGPPLLMTRNLLYTAVTRARMQVRIVGRRQNIMQMIENVQTRKRFCGLYEQLTQFREMFS